MSDSAPQTNNLPIIGVSGYARAGKSTCAESLVLFLAKRGIRAEITPLADAVKQDLDSFLREKAGISAFTEKTEEKNLIRPLLVAYATNLQRTRDPEYWINKIRGPALEKAKSGIWVIIPDVRYENEQDFILGVGGTCILAASHDQKPANEEERINTPLVAKRCAHHILSTKLFDFSLERYGLLFANREFEKILNKYWFTSRAHLEEGHEIGAGSSKIPDDLSWGDLDFIDSSSGTCSFGEKGGATLPLRVTPCSYEEILAEYGHTPESAKKLKEEIESLMAAKDDNPHHGSTFDSFLKEEGILEQTERAAKTRVSELKQPLLMKKQLTLSVTAVMTDGQDGGYSVRFYKDEATAKESIAKCRGVSVEDVDWDDEYINGYFSNKTFTVSEEDGVLSLEKDVYLHFGQ